MQCSSRGRVRRDPHPIGQRLHQRRVVMRQRAVSPGQALMFFEGGEGWGLQAVRVLVEAGGARRSVRSWAPRLPLALAWLPLALAPMPPPPRVRSLATPCASQSSRSATARVASASSSAGRWRRPREAKAQQSWWVRSVGEVREWGVQVRDGWGRGEWARRMRCRGPAAAAGAVSPCPGRCGSGSGAPKCRPNLSCLRPAPHPSPRPVPWD